MQEYRTDLVANLSPKVAALVSLDNEMEIIERLNALAGDFGTVVGISPLPELIKSDKETATYLISFEMTHEALAAARELQCVMVGFTTVMVSIPRPPTQMSPGIRSYANSTNLIAEESP